MFPEGGMQEERSPRDEGELKSFFCCALAEGLTEADKRAHKVTLLPFRARCTACVRESSADWPRKSREFDEL